MEKENIIPRLGLGVVVNDTGDNDICDHRRCVSPPHKLVAMRKEGIGLFAMQ